VLLALVEAGMSRDDAYRIVQRAAAAAWDEGASFHDEIAKDPEVIARLEAGAVDALFDPQRFLVKLGPLFDRLEALEVAS
jgi:adenylosuccinate lyase